MSEQRDLEGAWRAIDELRWRLAEANRESEQVRRKYVPMIEAVVKEDEIAEAVAKKLNSNRALSLTKVQKWTAILGVLLTGVAISVSVALQLVHG